MNMQDKRIQTNKHADSHRAPIQLITPAFSCFNQENNKQFNDLSSSPFFITIGTDTRLFGGYGEAINFDEVKKDGWVITWSKISLGNLIQQLFIDIMSQQSKTICICISINEIDIRLSLKAKEPDKVVAAIAH